MRLLKTVSNQLEALRSLSGMIHCWKLQNHQHPACWVWMLHAWNPYRAVRRRSLCITNKGKKKKSLVWRELLCMTVIHVWGQNIVIYNWRSQFKFNLKNIFFIVLIKLCHQHVITSPNHLGGNLRCAFELCCLISTALLNRTENESFLSPSIKGSNDWICFRTNPSQVSLYTSNKAKELSVMWLSWRKYSCST